MRQWTIELNKPKGYTEDSYLEEFLHQAESIINGLQIEDNINSFVQELGNWDGYNNYYNNGKFICRGGYMNIDELSMIHSNSNHSIFDAYGETRDSVYSIYNDESSDLYPVIPFVLVPKQYTSVAKNCKIKIDYKLEREGRSRLAGVLKARRNNCYYKNTVPVQFSIRRAKK
jgi:hypothetical protein